MRLIRKLTGGLCLSVLWLHLAGCGFFQFQGVFFTKTRIAVVSIIVEDASSVEALNSILFSFREYVIGRMGIPYREKQVSLISVAIDAPEDKINALTGKIGKLNGVSAKTNYSNIITEI